MSLKVFIGSILLLLAMTMTIIMFANEEVRIAENFFFLSLWLDFEQFYVTHALYDNFVVQIEI